MEKAVDPLFIIKVNEKNPKSLKILPTSILKIDQLGLLAAPAEFTIMCGRRIKSTVAGYKEFGFKHLIFVGYSDAYAGYVTTREEYSSQQYEGASIHFGPWTLAAYRQNFDRLAKKMLNPTSNSWEKEEPAVTIMKPAGADKTVQVQFDDKPTKEFGDIEVDAKESYSTGDIVEVSFWGAHSNNDSKTNETYLKVQKLTDSDDWKTVYTDRDTNTKLLWERVAEAYSLITISWVIRYYKIVDLGDWKNG